MVMAVQSTLCLVDTLSVFGSNEACDALEENLEGVNTLTVDSAVCSIAAS